MIHLLLVVIYISFISLGLPDGLLGAGWPAMQPQFDVPISYSGIIFFIICIYFFPISFYHRHSGLFHFLI